MLLFGLVLTVFVLVFTTFMLFGLVFCSVCVVVYVVVWVGGDGV